MNRHGRRHLRRQGADIREAIRLATKCAEKRRFKMRRTILTILGSALLAASTIQIAAAAEHHRVRKAEHAPAPASEPFRNANAYAPSPWAQPDVSRYQYGAGSAPAGH